jgi:hypothetical protein
MPIAISFLSIATGNDSTYMYYLVEGPSRPSVVPLPPQLWFCRDVYWSPDIHHGLRFHKYGVPTELDTGEFHRNEP